MMCKRALIVILILSKYISYAQQDFIKTYDSIVKTPELTIDQQIIKVEDLIRKNENSSNELIMSKIYHEFAKKVYRYNIEKAIEYAYQATRIRKKHYVEFPDLFKVSYSNLANFHYKKGDYLKSLKTYDSILKYCDKEEIRVAKVHWGKASVYRSMGDFKKALDCYAVSEAIYMQSNNQRQLLKIYKNVSAIYAGMNDVKHKEVFFENNEKINELSKNFTVSERDFIGVKINLGNFYDTLGDYENSIVEYSNALKKSLKIEDSLLVSKSLNNLGIVNRKMNNVDKAIQYFERALKYSVGTPLQEAVVYDNLGDVCVLEKNYLKALGYYQKAINFSIGNTELDYETLPTIQDIELSENKIYLLGYLIDKANVWVKFEEMTTNDNHSREALKTFELIDQVIDGIYFESREDLSKLFWRDKGTDLYLKATRTCYKLGLPEKAFYFIEKSKAFLLLENVTDINARALANLPDEIIKRELKLLREIDGIRGELEKSDIHKKEELKREVFFKKNEYAQFVDSLEVAFPKYHDYKKGIKVVDAMMAQEHLKENQLLLQYKIGNDQAFVSLVSKKEISVFKIKEGNKLKDRVMEFQEYLRKPFVNHEDQNKYKDLAFKLYKQLFPFMDTTSTVFKNKHLLIVQDDVLQNIPFEPLLVENSNKPLNEVFLINSCKISYAYSFSSLMSSNKIKRKYANDYLAMGPTYFKDDSLSSLITYEDEVKTLEKELNTPFLIAGNATKQEFVEAYGGYKVVHLSTHGGVSLEKKPWLAFHDDKLELDEMYFTNQYSDLVVLSACKTSRGELKKGEGVMSIARGFVNSGAQSVLASLWDIDLKANNEITYAFYEYLNDGKTKGEALRQAKMDYLERHGNTSEASPYYWSAITLIGNDAPVFKKKNKSFLLLLLLLPVWIVYKRRKRRLASA